MNKAGDGTWSVTVGPIKPAVYRFTIDGVGNINPWPISVFEYFDHSGVCGSIAAASGRNASSDDAVMIFSLPD
jgi:hypothetical protein